MRVRVLFFGQLKDAAGKSEEELPVAEGSTLGELFEECARRYPRLGALRPSIVFARNREFAGAADRLADGDEVAFLPPVSGGMDDEFVALVREPIDTRALAAGMARGEDGAVVVFEGVVRNNSQGRPTLYLEYEAYEPMALAQMRRLAAELRSEFKLGRVAVVHRLGRLEIGETSVAIVVTAPHRGPAFEACRAMIDRLKKIVPIWKKEYFAGGAVWVS